MPKIQRVLEQAREVAGIEVPAPSRAPALVPYLPHPHSPADHLAFRNADGSTSRVCICVCARCWPPEFPQNPPPCPDWNDGSV